MNTLTNITLKHTTVYDNVILVLLFEKKNNTTGEQLQLHNIDNNFTIKTV